MSPRSVDIGEGLGAASSPSVCPADSEVQFVDDRCFALQKLHFSSGAINVSLAISLPSYLSLHICISLFYYPRIARTQTDTDVIAESTLASVVHVLSERMNKERPDEVDLLDYVDWSELC